jgi:hypothetical protein
MDENSMSLSVNVHFRNQKKKNIKTRDRKTSVKENKIFGNTKREKEKTEKNETTLTSDNASERDAI